VCILPSFFSPSFLLFSPLLSLRFHPLFYFLSAFLSFFLFLFLSFCLSFPQSLSLLFLSFFLSLPLCSLSLSHSPQTLFIFHQPFPFFVVDSPDIHPHMA